MGRAPADVAKPEQVGDPITELKTLSTAEFAAALDLSCVAAGSYFGRFADTGIVERARRPGRPEAEYRRH